MSTPSDFDFSIHMDAKNQFTLSVRDSEGYASVGQRKLTLEQALAIFDRVDATVGSNVSQFTRNRVRINEATMRARLKSLENAAEQLHKELGLVESD